MFNATEIGENLGAKLRQFLQPIPNRLGVVIFLFFWHTGGVGIAIVMIGLYCLILRKMSRGKKSIAEPLTTHGSARWATIDDLAGSNNATLHIDHNRLIFGLSKNNLLLQKGQTAAFTVEQKRLLGNTSHAHPIVTSGNKDAAHGDVDDAHCITIAGAGAGKGVSVVIPNLLNYQGSVVAFDPKGENFLQTVDARVQLGSRVTVLDPFRSLPEHIRIQYEVRLDPLERFVELVQNEEHDQAFDEARGIADLMVVVTGQERDPHFNEKAVDVIAGVILFAAYAHVYADRSQFPLDLVTVKDAFDTFFLDPEKHKVLVDICRKNPRLKTVVGTMAGMAGNERLSVISTAERNLSFLNSSRVSQSLRDANFHLTDFKREKVSLYLVLPANQLDAYGRLARLWVGSFLRTMMFDTEKPRHRVLCLLDECAQLRRLNLLLNAVSLGRGYGLDIWMLFQDMAQIKEHYKESAETLLSNAKYQQYFGIGDLPTAEKISGMLGKMTIETVTYSEADSRSDGINWGTNSGGSEGQSTSTNGRNRTKTRTTTTGVSYISRDLLEPSEVMKLPATDVIIFMRGLNPVLADRYDIRQPSFREALTPVTIAASSYKMLEEPATFASALDTEAAGVGVRN